MPAHTPTSTIAAYAAGASLAAVTLVYVFSPSLFLDDSGNTASPSSARRKAGVVGLSNPANDCFINSVLQALAGLGELRVYLIRELHRRQGMLDEDSEAFDIVEVDAKASAAGGDAGDRARWKQLVLQRSIVTAALKGVLDRLNERPLAQKTIGNGDFVRELERAFGTRISRQQQDAQEFWQLVAERVEEEWVALGRVRKRVVGRRRRTKRDTAAVKESTESEERPLMDGADDEAAPQTKDGTTSTEEQEAVGDIKEEEDTTDPTTPNPFPFSGTLESYVECQTCHFIPKPSRTPFVTLTLHVPQASSQTTLDACIDGLLKIEHIDDYKCDRCRLEHALSTLRTAMQRAPSDEPALELNTDIARLQEALDKDPSSPPAGITLPPIDRAPKRSIAKHVRITHYPRILAVHLSRSIFTGTSSKNTSKVTFPEMLTLGGLKDRHQYRLLAMVTHVGAHHSGHYETFRRQIVLPSWSPRMETTQGPYEKASAATADDIANDDNDDNDSENKKKKRESQSSTATGPTLPSPSLRPSTTTETTSSPRSSLTSTTTTTSTSTSTTTSSAATTTLTSPPQAPQRSTSSSSSLARRKTASSYTSSIPSLRRKRAKNTDRWWRISDEKVRECDTTDVLGMRGEVYLLFYEMVG